MWASGICDWNGNAYVCSSNKVTSNGVTGWICKSGSEVWCNSYGPNANATPYSPTAGAPGFPASINVRLIDLQALAPEAGFHYLWLPGAPREG